MDDRKSVKFTRGAESLTYSFDAVGNRLNLIKDSMTTNYTYNEENQLLSWTDGVNTANYAYDNNGNLIQKAEDGLTTGYGYDHENRLTNISYPDSLASMYTYDGVGKRVQTFEDGVIINYLYDGLNALIERNTNDTTIATYTRGLSYGGGIAGIISKVTPTAMNYYHYDGIGGVTGLTDPAGNITQSYQYDAYGNLLTPQAPTPHGFSTKEFSPKSGLIYFGARYYDPTIGRFITKDPYSWAPDDARNFENPNTRKNLIVKAVISYIGVRDPRNFHRYIYCLNNPANYADPLGYIPKWLKNLIDHLLALLGVGLDVVSTSSGQVGQAAGVLGTGLQAATAPLTVKDAEEQIEKNIQPRIDRDQQILNDISKELGWEPWRARGTSGNPGYFGKDTRVKPGEQ